MKIIYRQKGQLIENHSYFILKLFYTDLIFFICLCRFYIIVQHKIYTNILGSVELMHSPTLLELLKIISSSLLLSVKQLCIGIIYFPLYLGKCLLSINFWYD